MEERRTLLVPGQTLTKYSAQVTTDDEIMNRSNMACLTTAALVTAYAVLLVMSGLSLIGIMTFPWFLFAIIWGTIAVILTAAASAAFIYYKRQTTALAFDPKRPEKVFSNVGAQQMRELQVAAIVAVTMLSLIGGVFVAQGTVSSKGGKPFGSVQHTTEVGSLIALFIIAFTTCVTLCYAVYCHLKPVSNISNVICQLDLLPQQ